MPAMLEWRTELESEGKKIGAIKAGSGCLYWRESYCLKAWVLSASRFLYHSSQVEKTCRKLNYAATQRRDFLTTGFVYSTMVGSAGAWGGLL